MKATTNRKLVWKVLMGCYASMLLLLTEADSRINESCMQHPPFFKNHIYFNYEIYDVLRFKHGRLSVVSVGHYIALYFAMKITTIY